MRVHHALASFALLIVIWQAIVWLTGLPHFILPSPFRVFKVFWDSRALIGEHALVTLGEVLLGMAIGTALGIATALHLALSPRARQLLGPILVFSQAIPVFALAPVLTLWLGYGLWSKIAMAVLIIYFPVTSSFLDGLLTTPKGYLDLAHAMQAKPRQVLLRIRIPAALPNLGTGLKLAAVYAPIGAVIGEWVGASRGLGYLMLLANGRAKTDLMFAAVLALCAMSVVLYLIFDALSRRLAARAAGG
ncbi:ABC transporter permease [Pseudoruegeria sp. SHC-113]|uniref:ABC transporter permease n=1 Tax=Pseudoruegeria sp. SHC-113 TaxID=2855439 RepID=UPI0021BB1FC0|nr:ABC transporter permease [Pseudoruegeria sp. SHC-113]MCT8161950.1 ABC transporter permease [Pseudoruegeria sp. SHC-113]